MRREVTVHVANWSTWGAGRRATALEPARESFMLEIQSNWAGPFAWPRQDNELPELPWTPGLYLQTFEYQGGFIVYGAGLTRRSVRNRLAEHTRHYKDGMYTVLDAEAARSGERKEVWHGFWTRARSPEKVLDFEARRAEIQTAAERQLRAFRIFVADIGTEPRLLERLEAATMEKLYESLPPFCDLPDRGMMLAPRQKGEEAILFRGACEHLLHALPPAYAI